MLGSEGRILDIGRTTRIFPPHIRKAITARDQGCAFPGCTIPAPWCEAHHITYWSHGGSTSTSNGTLLCSSHHHLIHKEQWQIQVKTGIPWFIPPPHIDPHQKPQRNQILQMLSTGQAGSTVHWIRQPGGNPNVIALTDSRAHTECPQPNHKDPVGGTFRLSCGLSCGRLLPG